MTRLRGTITILAGGVLLLGCGSTTAASGHQGSAEPAVLPAVHVGEYVDMTPPGGGWVRVTLGRVPPVQPTAAWTPANGQVVYGAFFTLVTRGAASHSLLLKIESNAEYAALGSDGAAYRPSYVGQPIASNGATCQAFGADNMQLESNQWVGFGCATFVMPANVSPSRVEFVPMKRPGWKIADWLTA